jgi:S1-C subfamily serine protease
VVRAERSTVQIVGAGCGVIQEGSGFVVAPGLVVTNAHVVAGLPQPMVQEGSSVMSTKVVLFDPSFDLAVMRVSGLNAPVLHLYQGTVDRGAQAAVLGYPEGGPFTVDSAGVMSLFEAVGRNIYGQGLTVRNVYEIDAIVRPGNSGGPLVLPNGQVVGVVFSRSTVNSNIGYALTSPAVQVRVSKAMTATTSVSTGPCTSS